MHIRVTSVLISSPVLNLYFELFLCLGLWVILFSFFFIWDAKEKRYSYIQFSFHLPRNKAVYFLYFVCLMLDLPTSCFLSCFITTLLSAFYYLLILSSLLLLLWILWLLFTYIFYLYYCHLYFDCCFYKYYD